MAEDRVQKYLEVERTKTTSPTRSYTQICEEQGVSYQSFYLWRKKREVHAKTVPQADQALLYTHKIRVGVMVSVRDVVNYILSNTTQIMMPIRDVLKSLSPEDQKKVAIELGNRQIAEINEGNDTSLGGMLRTRHTQPGDGQ